MDRRDVQPVPSSQASTLRVAVIGLVALVIGAAGGLAVGLRSDDGGDDRSEAIPRAATPAAADVRIEGDDTELKQLLAGLFSGGNGATVDLVTGELPEGYPDTFPAVPGAVLLGGLSSSNPGSGGLNGSTIYRSEEPAETVIESLVEAAATAGWWEPERPNRFPQPNTVFAQFCRDDWGRTGMSLSAMATPGDGDGSYVNITFFVNRGGSQCAPDTSGHTDMYRPPPLLQQFQTLRPEGAEPDFRFGSGTSGSDSTYTTSSGFRFDGSALTIARFYARELSALDATAGEPVGDEDSAVLPISTVVETDDGVQEFAGWVLVTRLEDAEDPETPVVAVHLTLVSLPDGVSSGVSGSFTTLE